MAPRSAIGFKTPVAKKPKVEEKKIPVAKETKVEENEAPVATEPEIASQYKPGDQLYWADGAGIIRHITVIHPGGRFEFATDVESIYSVDGMDLAHCICRDNKSDDLYYLTILDLKTVFETEQEAKNAVAGFPDKETAQQVVRDMIAQETVYKKDDKAYWVDGKKIRPITVISPGGLMHKQKERPDRMYVINDVQYAFFIFHDDESGRVHHFTYHSLDMIFKTEAEAAMALL